jgi:uncharacterized protein YbjT (DUF2867 family)
VLSRDPQCEEARALVARAPDRVSVLAGSAADLGSLARAVDGVYGVFCNTNFFSTASVASEVAEGLAALEAARRAGVQHFVYAALDSLVALSQGRLPVPHFDAKAAVAARIDERRSDEYMRRGLGDDGAGTWYLERTTVLVTAPYFENLKSFFRPYPAVLSNGSQGMLFRLPFDTSRWPMVALDDIGWFARHVLEEPGIWGGRTLSIASDEVTGEELAGTFARVTGLPAEYAPMPLREFEELPIPLKHDFVNMVKAVNEYGLPRDLPKLRAIHPGLLSFESWLRKTGWRGEPAEFMKSGRARTGGERRA